MDNDTDADVYPNWSRGLRRGLVAGLLGGLVCGVLLYSLPRSPDEVSFENLQPDVILRDSLTVGLVVFCCLFALFGILGALRPVTKSRR